MGAQEGSLLYGLKIGDTKEIDGKTYLLEKDDKGNNICEGCYFYSNPICNLNGGNNIGCGELDCILTEVKTEDSKSSDPLDRQVGGSHYSKESIQPLHFTETNKLTFSEGNVVKYITRYKDKNGLQDLQKVEHYLEFVEKYSETGRSIETNSTLKYCLSNKFSLLQGCVLFSMFEYLERGDGSRLDDAKFYARELMKEYEL